MEYPSRALVTGGAGFIGSHIVEELLRNGSEVVILDDFSTGRVEHLREIGLAPGLTIVKGSITDSEIVDMSMKDVDVVFHEAGISSVQESMMDPAKTNYVNVEGTRKLLRSAVNSRTCTKFIFASGAAVYGDAGSQPIKEESPRRPTSPLGQSKLNAEKLCFDENAMSGLGTIALRYFNVYGARSNGNVVSKFLERMKRFQAPVIYGDGSSSRDFVYVKDVVFANLLAVSGDKGIGKPYNIATGIRHTVEDLARAMSKILYGLRSPMPKLEYRAPLRGDRVEILADVSRTKEELGFEARYTLEDGLSDYFRQLFGKIPLDLQEPLVTSASRQNL